MPKGGGGASAKKARDEEPASADRPIAATPPPAETKDRAANLTRAGSVSLPARVLRARIRLAKDGVLVLEIAVDAPLSWLLAAQLLGRGGALALMMLDVIVEQSTAAGALVAGQTARLVLRTTHVPAQIIAPDGSYVIEVAGA